MKINNMPRIANEDQTGAPELIKIRAEGAVVDIWKFSRGVSYSIPQVLRHLSSESEDHRSCLALSLTISDPVLIVYCLMLELEFGHFLGM